MKENEEESVTKTERDPPTHHSPHPFLLPGNSTLRSGPYKVQQDNGQKEYTCYCPAFPSLSHVTQVHGDDLQLLLSSNPNATLPAMKGPSDSLLQLPPPSQPFDLLMTRSDKDVPQEGHSQMISVGDFFTDLVKRNSESKVQMLLQQYQPRNTNSFDLWTDKYKPQKHNELIGNDAKVKLIGI